MKPAKYWHDKYPMAFDNYYDGVVEEIQADAIQEILAQQCRGIDMTILFEILSWRADELRAGRVPSKVELTPEQLQRLEAWGKASGFELDGREIFGMKF